MGHGCTTQGIAKIEPDTIAPDPFSRSLFPLPFPAPKPVLQDFDVLHETGKPLRSVVKEFKGVAVTKGLTIRLTPVDDSRVRAPVLSSVEIVAEGW